MLLIQITMIFAMPGTPAVTVPAAMLRPMIPRLVAMKYAMLAPARIGRVQVPVILSDIAMVSPMAAAGMIVAVAGHNDIDMMTVRPPGRSLNLLGALGTPRFDPIGPLRPGPWTIIFAMVGLGKMAVATRLAVLLLSEGRHRRRPGQEKGSYQFMHIDSPDDTRQ